MSDQLRALLTRPSRTSATVRTYLYSGILRCWKCGKGLAGRPHDNGRRRYVCAKQPGNGRCGSTTVYADLAEAEVRDKVLTALDDPEFVTRVMSAGTSSSQAEDVTTRLREIETQRTELADMWRAKEIDRKEWLAARAGLNTEADDLTATLARSEHGRALAEFAAMEGELWQRWDILPDGAKRALVTAVTDHITVLPATRGHAWDPDRIDPTWRV